MIGAGNVLRYVLKSLRSPRARVYMYEKNNSRSGARRVRAVNSNCR